jgi:predicted metalloenzyme YecM
MIMILDSCETFLETFFLDFETTGISLDTLRLDHLGYQTSSSADYAEVKSELMHSSSLAEETIFNDRRIGIFILKSPIQFKDFLIDIIEVVEPEIGQIKESGWEHVEFTYNDNIEALVEKHPKLGWDKSALDRDQFPMLKLKLPSGLRVKIPKKGLKAQLADKDLYKI